MQRPVAGSPCSGPVADLEGARRNEDHVGQVGGCVEPGGEHRRLSCRRVFAFCAAGRRLTLFYLSGPAYVLEYPVLDEGPDAVIVGIVESSRSGPKRRAGVQRTVEVDLGRPLDGRDVVDAQTGKRLLAALEGEPYAVVEDRLR